MPRSSLAADGNYIIFFCNSKIPKLTSFKIVDYKEL